jgi:hypothetical protein
MNVPCGEQRQANAERNQQRIAEHLDDDEPSLDGHDQRPRLSLVHHVLAREHADIGHVAREVLEFSIGQLGEKRDLPQLIDGKDDALSFKIFYVLGP